MLNENKWEAVSLDEKIVDTTISGELFKHRQNSSREADEESSCMLQVGICKFYDRHQEQIIHHDIKQTFEQYAGIPFVLRKDFTFFSFWGGCMKTVCTNIGRRFFFTKRKVSRETKQLIMFLGKNASCPEGESNFFKLMKSWASYLLDHQSSSQQPSRATMMRLGNMGRGKGGVGGK